MIDIHERLLDQSLIVRMDDRQTAQGKIRNAHACEAVRGRIACQVG